MNFKNFLTNDELLQESQYLADTQPVVLGYGSFYPFHIGYLPMISEMVKLGERHSCDALMMIVPPPEMSDVVLETVIAKLKRDFSCLQVVVERNVTNSVIKLGKYEHAPVAILGEPMMVAKALAAHKVTFGESATVDHIPGYLEYMQQMCEEAVSEDDFESFRSHVLFDDVGEASTIFNELKEAHG